MLGNAQDHEDATVSIQESPDDGNGWSRDQKGGTQNTDAKLQLTSSGG